MRHIDRLEKPAILARKQALWQEKFDKKRSAKPGSRPDSSKYAHKNIRTQLMSMSHCKCFYCEGLLTDIAKEVDHFIEVACDPSKAYQWENLYLACQNCNDKVSHDSIPVTDALDPCNDSNAVIQSNLTFSKEIICPVPGSLKGEKTITKFRLDSELLDSQRAKWLNKINDTIREILLGMIEDGRKELNEEEVRKLETYMQPTSPFSLMSEIFIKTRLKDLLH